MFIERKYLPRITLKGSQSSPRISGNLSQFAIRVGLIRGLNTVINIQISPERYLVVNKYCKTVKIVVYFFKYIDFRVLGKLKAKEIKVEYLLDNNFPFLEIKTL